MILIELHIFNLPLCPVRHRGTARGVSCLWFSGEARYDNIFRPKLIRNRDDWFCLKLTGPAQWLGKLPWAPVGLVHLFCMFLSSWTTFDKYIANDLIKHNLGRVIPSWSTSPMFAEPGLENYSQDSILINIKPETTAKILHILIYETWNLKW